MHYHNRRVFICQHAKGTPVLTDFGISDDPLEKLPEHHAIVKVYTLSIDAWILTF